MSDDVLKKNFLAMFDQAVALDDETQESPLIDSLSGIKNRYTDFQQFAIGGSKIIYKCFDKNADRVVALAQAKQSTRVAQQENFLREARISAMLQHPNIIPIYDMGLIDEAPFFVMKFISGNTLADILEALRKGDSKCLEEYSRSELIDIFLKICDAVSYAHARGVIHLDLKPENIRISEFGDVLLCDWGLAIVLDDTEVIYEECSSLENYSLNSFNFKNMTQNGYVKGTPGFMAPEQTGRTDIKKGRHSDIYSLGAILYSLLTFQEPIKGGSLEEVLDKTARGDFLAPSEHKKGIPKPLELICLKAMATAIEERYGSVQSMQADILAFRNGFAISAEENSNWKLLKLLIKRNLAISLIASSAGLILIIFSIVFTRNLQDSRNQALEAKNEALQAQSQATKSKEAALVLAEKFKTEKEISIRRGKIATDQLLKYAQEAYRKDDFNRASQHINSALELDNELPAAWLIRAKLHFLNEEFNLAYSSFIKAGEDSDLVKLADEYRQVKKDDSLKFTMNKYIDFFNRVSRKLGKGSGLISDLTHVKIYSQISIDDRLHFSRAWIRMFNDLETLNLSYDSSIRHLDLSHNSTLDFPYVLQNFPARSADFSHTAIDEFICFRAQPLLKLDVSHTKIDKLDTLSNKDLRDLILAHTGISDLSPLKGMPLQSLDIRGCPIKSLTVLESLKQLQQLIISPQQFSPEQIEQVPQGIEIKKM